jgi:hypothetical protein
MFTSLAPDTLIRASLGSNRGEREGVLIALVVCNVRTTLIYLPRHYLSGTTSCQAHEEFPLRQQHCLRIATLCTDYFVTARTFHFYFVRDVQRLLKTAEASSSAELIANIIASTHATVHSSICSVENRTAPSTICRRALTEIAKTMARENGGGV